MVREKLHQSPLLKINWFRDKSVSDNRLIELISCRLKSIASQNPEIAHEIVDTATSWSRFDCGAAHEIKKRTLNGLNICS